MEERFYSEIRGKKIELVKSTCVFLTALKDAQRTDPLRQEFLSKFLEVERIDPVKDSGLLICYLRKVQDPDASRSKRDQLMAEISHHPHVRYVTPAFRPPEAPDEHFMLQGDRIVAQFPDKSPENIIQELQRRDIEIIKAFHHLKHGYLLRVKEEAHKTALEVANEINEGGFGTAEVDWLRVFSPR